MSFPVDLFIFDIDSVRQEIRRKPIGEHWPTFRYFYSKLMSISVIRVNRRLSPVLTPDQTLLVS